MKLLVDIGNTRVRWAVFREGVIGGVRSSRHEECASAWSGLPVENALYCSVAPAARCELVLAALANIPCRRVMARQRCGGVINGYERPERLGDDRWAALLAARSVEPERHVIIADAGTAVTLDSMDCSGRHHGGAILAGPAAQRSGLAALAPGLPAVGGKPGLPARGTSDALASGAWIGLAGGIEHVANALTDPQADSAFLLTGGDAAALRPWLSQRWRHDPLLTLRGLLIAEEHECAGSPSSS